MKLFKKIRNLYKKNLKVGVVLGSGGRFGISHIGVLKVLEKNNIKIDYLVGCSMGAIIGAIYAINPNIEELEKKAVSLNKRDLIRLIDLGITKTSLIKGKNIKKFIKELVGDKTFSDVKIPFKVVATDLETGEFVVINEGKLIDAIMASISIPGIFPPVKLDRRLLVDGGVTNATPINVVKEMGADIIIGVDLTMKGQVKLENLNIIQILLRTYDILRTQVTKNNIENNKNVLIIKPNISTLSKFKFYEIEKFINEGEKTAKKNLSKIKKLVFNEGL